MGWLKKIVFLGVLSGWVSLLAAPALPDLTKKEIHEQMKQLFSLHAVHHQFTPTLTERTLSLFIEELDPTHTYFLKEEVEEWVEPTTTKLKEVSAQFNRGDFAFLETLFNKFSETFDRKNQLEAQVRQLAPLQTVTPWKTLKEAGWPENLTALQEQIHAIHTLQMRILKRLDPENSEGGWERLEKRRFKVQEKFRAYTPKERESFFASLVLKATASSLDSHTLYLTPAEAEQFLIQVQQRLVGLGVQIRDDCDGFTIAKILENGPAQESGLIHAKDKIIAINGESMIGNDIQEVVDAIRGPKGTTVTLTLLRGEEIVTVTLKRDEVILSESRMESKKEPFGDQSLAVLRLFCFYQEGNSSSGNDLRAAFKEMQAEGPIAGVLLDLRGNMGGLLPQALDVAGLFLRQGVIACIQDGQSLYRLTNPNKTPLWEGPLVILIDHSSASAAEIVAQSLQDWERAVVVGDPHTFGKGTFQSMTTNLKKGLNPKGEYNVTRGVYYTVSGKTPQLQGVKSDIVIPGWQAELEIGEKFTKYPLEGGTIPEQFDQIFWQAPLLTLKQSMLQKKGQLTQTLIASLREKSAERLANNSAFQDFLLYCQSQKETEEEQAESDKEWPDFQYEEALAILKDLGCITN